MGWLPAAPSEPPALNELMKKCVLTLSVALATATTLAQNLLRRLFLEGCLKPVLFALVVWTLASTSFAQGLVTFGNGPTTLITFGPASSGSPLPANEAGGFYFGRLISTNPAGPFTFTGVYATSSATAGRIGVYTLGVPGWPPCTSLFYEIAGWSSNLDPVWNPGWLVNNLSAPGDDPVWSEAPTNSYFGLSGIAAGTASASMEFCGPAWNLCDLGSAFLKDAPQIRTQLRGMDLRGQKDRNSGSAQTTHGDEKYRIGGTRKGDRPPSNHRASENAREHPGSSHPDS